MNFRPENCTSLNDFAYKIFFPHRTGTTASPHRYPSPPLCCHKRVHAPCAGAITTHTHTENTHLGCFTKPMPADSVPSQVSSWACLVVVLWVCACVVHPVQFTFPTAGFVAAHLLPRGLHGATLHLSSATAPPMGVLVLRLFDVLPLGDVVSCLISVGEVKPWQVLLIFFTLAYASISVDVTGLSKFIAIRTLRSIQTKSPGAPSAAVASPPLVGDDPRLSPTTSSVSGIPSAQQQGGGGEVSLRRLLVVVYLLSGVIALLASNDVVVLTLTPVLIHFCQSWNVDPIPVLLVEY